MQLTPTDKGATIAGIAFASICWASVFKIDYIAELLHIRRWVSQESILDWIGSSRKNQALAIVFTEIANYATHGVTNVSSTMFALGSSVVNMFMIFLFVPMRYKFRQSSKQVKIMGKGAAA